MVSFSNAHDTQRDSVNGQRPVPSKPIQMDAKISVQFSILPYCKQGPYWGHKD